MRVFGCAHCGQLVYFENTYCERCRHALGFVTEDLCVSTLLPAGNNTFHVYNKPEAVFKYCVNHSYGVCNWLIPAGSADIFCQACALNKTIPDISTQENTSSWLNIENAKHRLLYSLYRLKLSATSKVLDHQNGLAFDFLANVDTKERVLTGHDDGLITINIEEADDVVRERVRKEMGEPYRTLLGHFRHEVGHYYWDRFFAGGGDALQAFRNVFGDESIDYGEALQHYYVNGASANWQQSHISVYASSHPWEDWAETWAHYLHMMDTLESAWSFGLNVMPRNVKPAVDLTATMDTDPYQLENFDDIVRRWLPFTYAMNSINRSMGLKDLYPFVMSPAAISKLSFIHETCRNAAHLVQQNEMQQFSAA